MLFVFICVILFSIILLISNDIMFNKRRKIWIKIIEFFICIFLIINIFKGAYYYMTLRNNFEYSLKNSSLFGSSLTVYNMNGEVQKETTIGQFLYDSFVRNVIVNEIDTKSPEYVKANIFICVISAILFIYWITLLLLFEKEEKLGYKIVDDKKIFEKYNPMIAACISQNRSVMCRDVIGVMINLINKKKINIRLVPDESIKKIGYRYMLSENPESNVRLDMIEKEIYDWIFEDLPKFNRGIKFDYITKNNEGIIELDFIKRLADISSDPELYARLKELNYTVKKRLNNMGANKEAVPFLLKAFNNSLIIMNVFLVVQHIMNNGINMTITNIQVLYYMFAAVFAISFLPVIYIVSLICFEFIRIYFKSLQQITEGYTGRRLIAKSISIIFATLLIMIIYASFANDVYIIFDILLIGITCLVVFTDDYMLKHDYKILNDYYNIKRIEKKIEDYSLMKKENIEYINLWDEYYAYAVAFGIPIEVKDKIDVAYEDTTILTSANLEGIFYVSKAYLEVMWDMEFSSKKSKIDILKFFK